MHFFQNLSLAFGIIAILSGSWILLWPEAYRSFGSKRVPEKCPGWYLALSIPWLLLILFTWYQFLNTPSFPTLAITLILSLSLIKLYAIVFHYNSFREWAFFFLNAPNSILRTFALMYVALGLLFVSISMTLY